MPKSKGGLLFAIQTETQLKVVHGCSMLFFDLIAKLKAHELKGHAAMLSLRSLSASCYGFHRSKSWRSPRRKPPTHRPLPPWQTARPKFLELNILPRRSVHSPWSLKNRHVRSQTSPEDSGPSLHMRVHGHVWVNL